MVFALNELEASDLDGVFYDFCSMFQIDKTHPDYCYGERLPAGHEALRTPEQDRLFALAMDGMDQ
eukprot:11588602-Alexandrium_andersonii.AAC.1